MGYESEMKADERIVEWEYQHPGTHGDFITDDDIANWRRQKQKNRLTKWLDWLTRRK